MRCTERAAKSSNLKVTATVWQNLGQPARLQVLLVIAQRATGAAKRGQVAAGRQGGGSGRQGSDGHREALLHLPGLRFRGVP